MGRYLDDNVTPQEKQHIENWYADFEQVEVDYTATDRNRIESDIRKGVYDQLRKKKSIRLNSWLKIAASILLPLIIGFSAWLLSNQSSTQPAPQRWIALETKAGERKKITLSDGSEIWMNAASRILYPAKFASNERQVQLMEGEAFFKIFHNEKHPFRVISPGQIYTRVLGTSFNICAYAQTNKIIVSVISGKVAVGKDHIEMARLIKGEGLSLNTKSLVIVSSLAEKADAWTRNEIVFNGHALADGVKLLSRAFGISIELAEGVNGNLKCRGNFNLSQGPDEIVKVLCRLHGLSYSSQKDRILIRPRK